jgi:hypothetical protein
MAQAVGRFQDRYGIATGPGSRGLAGPQTREKLRNVYASAAVAPSASLSPVMAAERATLIRQLQERLLNLQLQLLRLLLNQQSAP